MLNVSAVGDEFPWECMSSALLEYFYEPDLDAVRATYAAIAAHPLSGQPVWPMIVAPAGSMKTTTLQPIEQFDGVWSIDKLTPNTFLSGQIVEAADDALI